MQGELIEDLMAMSGLSADEARALIARDQSDDQPNSGPFPEWLRPAIEIAAFAKGQWRWLTRPMHAPDLMGMDWSAWERAAKWLGYAIDRDVFVDLQIIEDEAMRIMRPS